MTSATQIRTVSEKMGVRPGSRAHLANVPPGAEAALALPSLERVPDLGGQLDYLHAFVRTQAELDDAFPRLRDHLRQGGMLWISWPKGGKLGTDLSLHHVIRIGYRHGLVESTCLSVDARWSALKFTWPKPGKRYNNSHAGLNRVSG